MKPLKLGEIAQAVGGKLNNPEAAELTVNGVSIDTRQNQEGKLFVALKGMNVDGHQFLEDAVKKGAACVLSEVETSVNAVIVGNSMDALGALAAYYRGLFDVKVVGITGSSGKTSCKDMIASVVGEGMNVIKTEGNYNNEIGMPLTIFNITEDTRVAVLEMGMNNRWEIHRLSKIARPDICVITNIGFAHIENLGSQEEIFNAKSEIMDFMAEDGQIFLYGDDEFLMRHSDKPNVTYFGRGEHNAYRPEREREDGLEGSSFIVHLKNGGDGVFYLPTPGEHMVTNALAAVAIGDYLGLEPAQIAAGLLKFGSSGMRNDIINTDSGIRIISDCYNANPDSMKAGLDVLALSEGTTVAILGDMFELGELAAVLHREVGAHAAQLCIDTIICVGTLAEGLYEGAYEVYNRGASSSQVIYFQSRDELIQHMHRIVAPGDTVLVKASRGMRFEEIVNKLERMICLES